MNKLLASLEMQTLEPYEVIIIAKDLDDETKSVIDSHERNLNINLVKQIDGNLPHAYSLGIRSASGNLILFIDDDAFAEPAWVEKYTKIFSQYENLGGASGRVITYKLNNNGIVVAQSEIRLHLTGRPSGEGR
ncbi:MAG: glycosyltransferase family A protein [Nitrososphaeria archaeon]